MSSDDSHCEYQHFKLHNWKFCLILVEQMIAFKDEHAIDLTCEEVLNNAVVVITHSPQILTEHHQMKCCVCQLEEGIQGWETTIDASYGSVVSRDYPFLHT